jgi:hypothetical protein
MALELFDPMRLRHEVNPLPAAELLRLGARRPAGHLPVRHHGRARGPDRGRPRPRLGLARRRPADGGDARPRPDGDRLLDRGAPGDRWRGLGRQPRRTGLRGRPLRRRGGRRPGARVAERPAAPALPPRRPGLGGRRRRPGAGRSRICGRRRAAADAGRAGAGPGRNPGGRAAAALRRLPPPRRPLAGGGPPRQRAPHAPLRRPRPRPAS